MHMVGITISARVILNIILIDNNLYDVPSVVCTHVRNIYTDINI
jgi:hypothetical protein